ncbi:AF17 C protein [Loa loa]|uniref:AF17 C protein n=2 Tax=Loa loa TaxID=7209 RepID=A0A1S0TQ80_LOALO|nr:AF17 C protein [Loa loa]EFO17459.2 AF17 C protein [Loa loa]
METIIVLIVVSSVAAIVQSEYYANYNDRLARDFMHFGKRSANLVPQFDPYIAYFKRGEFSRDFMNFGKRSTGDGNLSDMMLKIGHTPELLHKKSNSFDREFMNFGKRMMPLERSLMTSNKKGGIDAFNREFLSFGKRIAVI